MVRQTVLLQLASLLAAISAAAGDNIALPGCQTKCGNVTIPYPFGIDQGCFLEGFEVTCNTSFNTPKPFIGDGNIDIVDIKLSEGLVVVNQYMAIDCYDKNGSNNAHNNPYMGLGFKYEFSNTRNKFIAIGCDTIGYIYDDNSGFKTGCMSACNSTSKIPNGTCSGIGCCEAPIPKDLWTININITSFSNHSNCWDFNPCSYAFVADDGWLNFSIDNFTSLRNVTDVPVTLDWAVGNQTCKEARNDPKSYACKADHSDCLNASNGSGYRCNCSEGFLGNPYLKDGCQDIDECMVFAPCVKECKNTQGNYYCSCPWNMYGDGRKKGSGCKFIWKLVLPILIGGFSLLILVFLGAWIYWIIRKRRYIKLKEKFFQRNGGLLLQQQISLMEGNAPATRIFTEEELIKATDNYKESCILGQGGVGTVYKGILADNCTVAIKKCKISTNQGIEQFINEVMILSCINHRNVVKLLGCCLETKVPLLVYEFVPNATLFDHLHSEGCKASLSLECRLRIATEVAGALAYLHSAASVPIIHRDVKSSNILLDENYTAKVSDFGTSRLVPFGQEGLTSLIRGTFGYLDPECFYTGKFTDKSDVYSFGVVLIELLTGKKPVEPTNTTEFTSLAILFNSCFREGSHLQILEERVLKEGSLELLAILARLAKRCLRSKGEERPTMREISLELEGLRRPNKHPWIEKNEEEGDDLLMAADCSTMGSTFDEGDSST